MSFNVKLDEGVSRELDEAPSILTERSVWSERVSVVIKLALAAFLVYWLVASGRLDFERLARIRPSWSVLVLVLFTVLSMVVPAIRWWYLITMQELDVPLWRVIRVTWLGYATSIFLPGAAGGDAARALIMLRAQSSARLRMVATIVVDRAIGLYTLLIVGAIAIIFCQTQTASTPAIRSLVRTSVAIFLLATVIISAIANRHSRLFTLAILPPRFAAAIDASWSLYAKRQVQLLLCAVISIIGHLFSLGCLAAAASVMELVVPIGTVMSVGPLIGLVNVLPLTPGGIGVGEAAADRLFSLFGVSLGADLFLLVRAFGIAIAVPALCLPNGAVPRTE